ncbi:MAG TPA: carboxypeptidase M32 [bacterium]|nr:carboxypeptidase M32 [bacterium]
MTQKSSIKKKPYPELIRRLREIHTLRGASAVIGWDEQVCMPPKGTEARAQQAALLETLVHEQQADPKLGECLEACARDPKLSEVRKAVVREARRDYDKAVKIPADLVHEISETSVKAHAVWVEARKKNAFRSFAPLLSRLVDLRKREAEALGYPKDGVPYDALLDHFEPGATVRELDPVFARTRKITIAATRAIAKSGRKADVSILKRRFPIESQEKLSRFLLDAMHYDLKAGRLDRSIHPFTTGIDIRDVRITTRYEERWLPGGLFGTIHEAGHALYEQALPLDHAGTPLGEALSMGLHESQSRLWENQIGRSLAFWKFLFPRVRRLFPDALAGVSLKDFYWAINAVRPSLIRVEADEATYNLHIIVRYELEKALFADAVSVKDLPALWNAKMKEYLGVVPRNDAEGVLQDIHWSSGSFGYFPTYLLGNLYAAQWMAALRRDFPDLDRRLARGDLLTAKKWLNEKIHRHGRRYTASELCRRVSGEILNPEYFGKYLQAKYGLAE